ncbi:SDR family oxidoreductase [Chondrinema litorale]|uniref:SDR family oxidoreductase n=1 Tax=Chondrinema litorale TaxID=2994555 RepID=UPI002542A1D7|nr:SDR family oxidoreductase [Chondrinema litorale]UZS00133.1 SDR family oxidoreductase [Chondrinema litorale]
MSTVLILGATSDMAVAIARKFAAEKYNIQLAGRNPDKLTPLKNDLESRFGVIAETFTFDACDSNSHQNFYSNIPNKPNIVICVFGYMVDESIANDNWKEAEKMIITNFTGAASILNIISNDFEKKKEGTIIGISSVAGERGRKSKLFYGSTKAGFSTFLAGLRNRATKNNVHVMSVKPGFVYTKMTEDLDLPPLLTAQPQEVASAIFRGLKKKKNTVYVKWIWRWIMLIIKLIPEPLFKKMNL